MEEEQQLLNLPSLEEDLVLATAIKHPLTDVDLTLSPLRPAETRL
jgi:hypothetical protein